MKNFEKESAFGTYRTVLLERLNIHAETRLPDVLSDFHVMVVDDLARLATKSLLAQISGYIWSERIAQKTVSYPANWWEAVKARFAPLWFRKRWPVEYTVIVLDARVAYPDFRPGLRGRTVPVVLEQRLWSEKFE